jgi:hypothetical protein
MYKLLNWIDKDKLNWKYLSYNPNAIYYFEKSKDIINWDYLSCNPDAIHYIEHNQDKLF